MKSLDFEVATAHHHFSVDCFNRVWELLEKPHRSPDEDRLMVSMCHASLFHWQQRPDCTSRNLSIGYWHLSRVYAVLGQSDNARDFAILCKQYSEGPFYLGYAFEALARAEFMAGYFDVGEQQLESARIYAAFVTDTEERALLERDLETMKSQIKLNWKRSRAFERETLRDALSAEIHEAFRHVTREGGVSWSETDVLDAGGSTAECEAARQKDTESHWSELIHDDKWAPGIGFCYLDAIGFRYYLAPAMIHGLLSGCDRHMYFQLCDLNSGWASILNDKQKRCVARFLLYMARRSDEPYLACNDKNEWLTTLNAGWWEYLEDEPSSRIE